MNLYNICKSQQRDIIGQVKGFSFDFCFEKGRKQDEEENERGRDRERRLRAANQKSLFEILLNLNQAIPNHLVDERVKRVCRIHHRPIFIRYRLVQVWRNLKTKKTINPFTATGYFHRQPPRWPTFLAMLFQILKEGMVLPLSDELEVQYPVIKK